jgi:hypothetical protein
MYQARHHIHQCTRSLQLGFNRGQARFKLWSSAVLLPCLPSVNQSVPMPPTQFGEAALGQNLRRPQPKLSHPLRGIPWTIFVPIAQATIACREGSTILDRGILQVIYKIIKRSDTKYYSTATIS